jgi:hypothetical protein
LCVCAPQDVFKTMDQIKAAGGKITKEAGALPGLGEGAARYEWDRMRFGWITTPMLPENAVETCPSACAHRAMLVP